MFYLTSFVIIIVIVIIIIIIIIISLNLMLFHTWIICEEGLEKAGIFNNIGRWYVSVND